MQESTPQQHQQVQQIPMSTILLPVTQYIITAPAAEPSYVVVDGPSTAIPPPNKCPPEKTLWMGDINPKWEADFIMDAFAKFGYQVHYVKFLTEKGTDKQASYCFVEFATEDDARNAMLKANGRSIPNDPDRRRFLLSFANSQEPHMEYNLYVNNLSPSVDDVALFNVFGKKYRSCRGAKIYRNPDGTSKETGIVRFTNQTDQQMALVEMNKVKLLGREMFLKLAHPKQRGYIQRGGRTWARSEAYQQYTAYGIQHQDDGGQTGLQQSYVTYPAMSSSNPTYSHGSQDSYHSGGDRHHSSRHKEHRRSRSPTNDSAVSRKNFIEPVNAPTADEHNEFLFDTDWDLQLALDSARFSKCLVAADINSKDLAVKLYEISTSPPPL